MPQQHLSLSLIWGGGGGGVDGRDLPSLKRTPLVMIHLYQCLHLKVNSPLTFNL